MRDQAVAAGDAEGDVVADEGDDGLATMAARAASGLVWNAPARSSGVNWLNADLEGALALQPELPMLQSEVDVVVAPALRVLATTQPFGMLPRPTGALTFRA